MIKGYFHSVSNENEIYSLESAFSTVSLLAGKKAKLLLPLFEGIDDGSFKGSLDINDVDLLLNDNKKSGAYLAASEVGQFGFKKFDVPEINKNISNFAKDRNIEDIDFIVNNVNSIVAILEQGPKYVLVDLTRLELNKAKLLAYFIAKVFEDFPILLYKKELNESSEDFEIVCPYVADISEISKIEKEDIYKKGYDAFINDIVGIAAPNYDELAKEEKVIEKEVKETNLVKFDLSMIVVKQEVTLVKENKKREKKVEVKEVKVEEPKVTLETKEEVEVKPEPKPVKVKEKKVKEKKPKEKKVKEKPLKEEKPAKTPLIDRMKYFFKNSVSASTKDNFANIFFMIIFLGLAIGTYPIYFYFGQGENTNLMYGICIAMTIFFSILVCLPISYLFSDTGLVKMKDAFKCLPFILSFILTNILVLGCGAIFFLFLPKLGWNMNRAMVFEIIYFLFPLISTITVFIILYLNKRKQERKAK